MNRQYNILHIIFFAIYGGTEIRQSESIGLERVPTPELSFENGL